MADFDSFFTDFDNMQLQQSTRKPLAQSMATTTTKDSSTISKQTQQFQLSLLEQLIDQNRDIAFLSSASYHNCKLLDKQHAKQVKKLTQDSRQFYVHSQVFLFDYKDQVFTLSESVFAGREEPKKLKQKCHCCQLANLELRCCHFCGESSCFVCCKSQRTFP